MYLQVHKIVRADPLKFFAFLRILLVYFLKVRFYITFCLLKLVVMVGFADKYFDTMDSQNQQNQNDVGDEAVLNVSHFRAAENHDSQDKQSKAQKQHNIYDMAVTKLFSALS